MICKNVHQTGCCLIPPNFSEPPSAELVKFYCITRKFEKHCWYMYLECSLCMWILSGNFNYFSVNFCSLVVVKDKSIEWCAYQVFAEFFGSYVPYVKLFLYLMCILPFISCSIVKGRAAWGIWANPCLIFRDSEEVILYLIHHEFMTL